MLRLPACMWENLKIKRTSLIPQVTKLPEVCYAHKDPRLPELFNSVVKVDFFQQTHHYCTGTCHAEGSSFEHRHTEDSRRSVKPVKLAAHLRHKFRSE